MITIEKTQEELWERVGDECRSLNFEDDLLFLHVWHGCPQIVTTITVSRVADNEWIVTQQDQPQRFFSLTDWIDSVCQFSYVCAILKAHGNERESIIYDEKYFRYVS